MLYVVAAVVLVFVANGAVLASILPQPLDAIAGNVVVALLYFGGTRWFRGRGEPVTPPRAWWRMTSRPKAGFVIGSLLVVSVAMGVASALTRSQDQTFTYVSNAVLDAALAFLYLRSSVRLRRDPPRVVAEPTPLPAWKPLGR